MELRLLFLILMLITGTTSCVDGKSSLLSQTLNSSGERLLFVSSGSCYGGGVALSTPSQTVVALDLATGAYRHTVIDYNVYAPGDSPISIAEYDAANLLVLVENAGGRRIDLIRKDGGFAQSHLTNATALSAVMRAIVRMSDGSLLVSKSSSIEKFGSNKARVTQGANPWISAPAGACATSTTLLSSIGVFANGKTLFTHAAVTPNNKVGLISATGYAAGADCLATTAAPATTSMPTSNVIHPSGKTLVAYGSTTGASNTIYSYDVDTTANTITGATAAFTDLAVVNGPSAMTVDANTGKVYVANAISTFNTIEEFTFSGTTLTRTRTTPLAGPNVYTKCISSMLVSDFDP